MRLRSIFKMLRLFLRLSVVSTKANAKRNAAHIAQPTDQSRDNICMRCAICTHFRCWTRAGMTGCLFRGLGWSWNVQTFELIFCCSSLSFSIRLLHFFFLCFLFCFCFFICWAYLSLSLVSLKTWLNFPKSMTSNAEWVRFLSMLLGMIWSPLKFCLF